MSSGSYARLHCDAEDMPDIEDPAIARVLEVVLQCAEGFAAECRAHPAHERDATRTDRVLCAVGIGSDEASGFLRALDEGLIELRPDGNFQVPGARACSPNLHLVGREGDGVKLHNEVLIHVAAYGELVLGGLWAPEKLVFDPFFGNDALDLWGYAAGPAGSSWRDGDIVFAAEAKARVRGGDGLQRLVDAFERLNADTSALVGSGPRRKWDEIARLTAQHPIELLLVADGARWWYEASRTTAGIRLDPLQDRSVGTSPT